jgi:branched-chain amino acid transport system substrate-binding protein
VTNDERTPYYNRILPIADWPLASNGWAARLAHEIWEQDVNRKGGLLGRPVQMICVDDATDPTKVPSIYKRLLDDEKVDLVVGGYGDNSVAPAM